VAEEEVVMDEPSVIPRLVAIVQNTDLTETRAGCLPTAAQEKAHVTFLFPFLKQHFLHFQVALFR
jgi:hypothetical protein